MHAWKVHHWRPWRLSWRLAQAACWLSAVGAAALPAWCQLSRQLNNTWLEQQNSSAFTHVHVALPPLHTCSCPSQGLSCMPDCSGASRMTRRSLPARACALPHPLSKALLRTCLRAQRAAGEPSEEDLQGLPSLGSCALRRALLTMWLASAPAPGFCPAWSGMPVLPAAWRGAQPRSMRLIFTIPAAPALP